MKCSPEILKYVNNQQWKLNCEYIDSECYDINGYVLVNERGCNETLFSVLLSRSSNIILAEENMEFLNNLLDNKINLFNFSCKNNIGKVINVKPITYGNRSAIYEIFNEYNDKFLLKINKRLEDDNIEDIILKYLTDVGYVNIPKYYCSIKYNNYYYGLITEYIEGEPAATYYVNSAIRYIKKIKNMDIIGNNIAKSLANLHNYLKECKDDFCKSEVVNEKIIEKWINRIEWREKWIRSNLDILHQDEKSFALESLDSIEELLSLIKPDLKALIGRQLMRIHGDLHLYQIIVSNNNVYFTDFEGEPYKYPANKLEKEMPERDLAALFRSIDYTAVMALQLLHGTSIGESLDLINDDILNWEYISSKEILSQYLNNISNPIKENFTQIEISLPFWLLERASYEIVYEMIARTGYHLIPMSYIIRMKEGKEKLFKI
ncbi:uncharacterized protein, probably involved in trehalose biosynthesis [Caldisphaera lagunensis DSM 15908]|uniref:Uncharacterized protein, probably involved in trehalose biosynthesis n=1 Tax=Caldisphaera lagunensis (strain DSM 15908 / JCM 11604 / ANMR 0165 / IC-154) TaxID=1056495 RepID=L0AAD0_CALLD|nr:hypothetical protein [Caldisphaera lagunensis]AFZ70072.1 uncharacterized protein, probably involved in trehalose biosynthesis [Caldisphaera lagunensis DSM 15908]